MAGPIASTLCPSVSPQPPAPPLTGVPGLGRHTVPSLQASAHVGALSAVSLCLPGGRGTTCKGRRGSSPMRPQVPRREERASPRH